MVKVELPYDSVIPFLDIYPKSLKYRTTKGPNVFMFITASSVIAKRRKWLKCPLANE